MSYSVSYTGRFKKSLKRCIRRGLDVAEFEKVISLLIEKGSLPEIYKPHKLVGDYAECWECHIQPDWLLVWKQNNVELTLLLIDTGTHSDLFG